MSGDDSNRPDDGELPPVVEDPPLTYGSYLRIPELLDLQRRLSDPPHHDEMLFIVIHQVYELWFKQLLHELDATVEAFDAGEVLHAHKVLQRVVAIQQVLREQIRVLETMTPREFADFRARLSPASGFQSVQFRELETLSGIKDERYLRYHRDDPDGHARLERRLRARTIWDAFVGLLHQRGFDVPAEAPDEGTDGARRLVEALRRIYAHNEDFYELYLLCESLLEYDENFQVWRFVHVKMVERIIGTRTGTGGSSGAHYLRSTLSKRFFPELWEVRSHIDDAG